MNRQIATALLMVWMSATSAAALELSLPLGAVETGKSIAPNGEIAVPVAPFDGAVVPSQPASGQISEQAWRFPIGSANLGEFASEMRQALAADGYEILLDCGQDRCGGYDFRYQITLLPEPQMHVDLGNYRFISARQPQTGSGPAFVQIMLSRSPGSGYLQLTTVSDLDGAELIATTKTPNFAALGLAEAGSVTDMLTRDGFAPLNDLTFQVGSSRLEDKPYQSLTELAGFLENNPEVTLGLVGHTDAQGTLEANLALSRARATAVRNKLINDHGISASRLEAAGVGYLSPRATNQTPEGRTKNRRVEVIITSTR